LTHAGAGAPEDQGEERDVGDRGDLSKERVRVGYNRALLDGRLGLGPGVAVGRGIDGMGSVRMPEPGDSVGCVGSSSVIVWQPARATAIAAAHQAFRVIGTPYA